MFAPTIEQFYEVRCDAARDERFVRQGERRRLIATVLSSSPVPLSSSSTPLPSLPIPLASLFPPLSSSPVLSRPSLIPSQTFTRGISRSPPTEGFAISAGTPLRVKRKREGCEGWALYGKEMEEWSEGLVGAGLAHYHPLSVGPSKYGDHLYFSLPETISGIHFTSLYSFCLSLAQVQGWRQPCTLLIVGGHI